MELPAGFVQSAPWGLLDTAGQTGGGQRLALPQGGGETTINAGPPVIVAADADIALSVDGRHRGIEDEGPEFAFGAKRYRHRILDVGTRPNEKATTLRAADGRNWRIEYRGFINRPGFAAGKSGSAPASRAAKKLDDFIFSCVERIRSGAAPNQGVPGWDALDDAWSEARLDPRDPPMELIVRHAEVYSRLLADLVRSPRRLLMRDRDMVAVDRVQQIDIACIRWLIRQPGRSVYEQAGPRQRILAVVREDDLDTLENRVVRDFAARSEELAHSYCGRFERYQTSDRWQLVNRYRMECHRARATLAMNGIGLPAQPVVANYALLRDPRYSRIWTGYREILRRLDDQDECWRWQHRLWSDFCRLAVQLAVRRIPGAEVVAETPLRLFDEQRRGRWTSLSGQSGVFIIDGLKSKHRLVVSVVADLSEPHARIPDWISQLCPSAVLLFDELETGKELSIPVWAMHSCSEEKLQLAPLAQSAGRALKGALNNHQLYHGGDDRAGGLVLISSSAAPETSSVAWDDNVAAVVLGPEGGALARGLATLGDAIRHLVERRLAMPA